MQVSVVIPAYNHAAFVGEALTSVLGGPFTDLEVVLVDDGSTDDTLRRVEAFGGDPRLRVLTQPNRGAHVALNRGLDEARGETVFILNSDDVFHPDRIPRLLAAFDDPGVAVATSWVEVVDAGGATIGVKHGPDDLLPPWAARGGARLAQLGDLRLALLESNWVSTTSNLAFRRRLASEVGLRFRPLRYCHDWDFVLEACRHGRVELVPEALVRYRVHPDNTIREGTATSGEGLMRFEILWVVACHAAATCRAAARRGVPAGELDRRLPRSLPRFGDDAILDQLLFLRGAGDTPPEAYDGLLAPDHPFRNAAVATLGAGLI
ncbi:MAG: glycosyltransferase [Acidimicrobiales bacterium]|nr:glycosyltransferase [Acidimicrobiales bacterium]